MSVLVAHASTLPAGRRALAPGERRCLRRLELGPARAREWIRGRVAAHALLGRRASVLAGRSGAPYVAGDRAGISLSHAGDWLAVAVARKPVAPGRARVAVDLAPRTHAPRLARLLARLRVPHRHVDPAAAWCALECALKLRELPVATLLARRPRVSVAAHGALLVRGLGAPVRAWIWRAPGFVLGLGVE